MWKIGYCSVWHAINNGIHSFKILGKSAGLHLKNRHVPTEFFFPAHFLRYLNATLFYYSSVIWLAAFGISTGYLLYFLHEESVAYNQRPFMTSASVKSVASIQFPAVTFCNMSPYNKSKVAPDPRDSTYHMAISPLSSIVGPVNWSDPYYQDNGYFRSRTNSDIKYETLDKSRMILMVMFDQKDVIGDLEEKVTRYGMCYTWNADGSASTTSTGNAMNFVALLNMNSDQNYQSIDSSKGLKVNNI